MALASGHWVDREVRGPSPSPRHGHALAVAGNVAFVFGGACSSNQQGSLVYFSDFYMLTVTPDDLSWEQIPHSGDIPPARAGHTLCVVKGKLFLFGGASSPDATECLPGVYRFDIMSLSWELLETGGVVLRTLGHSSVAVGDDIYVYGGVLDRTPTDDLLLFNTVSLNWTPVKTSGSAPPALWAQSFAPVGDQVFMFGGVGAGGDLCKDLYVLQTESLRWQKCELRGESPAGCSGQTLAAHHDKDVYMFGGKITNDDGSETSSNEIHKLSVAKRKWKVPLYVGIPPARRHGHASFILHSHLFVFGGKNEEQDLNDLKVMKLINPSERQPVMKEILSEFGLQGVSHSFSPTKVPNVRYELSESPACSQPRAAAADLQVSAHRDFSAVREQAMMKIQAAFGLLDQEFQKLDREKMELSKSAAALQRDKEAHEAHRRQQQQELQEMLERHRSQNEAWLRARAEENDRERRELCRLREEVLQDQERLKEEQLSVQKRSEHLLSIMQQFKGM
ncbi:rab9 effector protein with kelch motifs [Kryptolebias marmoratus]|uniref:rab9 effector protein with kelch motifs n=1 Tax=Kryptolebias marmoratus TaxID=37003 RepID=UPI0018ACEE41|nr:rab9 effector protein with kelch motifs [Kryptolebias marmoratus]